MCGQTDGSVPNTLVIANCDVVKSRVAAAEHISQVIHYFLSCSFFYLLLTFIQCFGIKYEGKETEIMKMKGMEVTGEKQFPLLLFWWKAFG